MSSAIMTATTMPANWTNTSGFNCVGVHSLPLGGGEILILAVVYLALLAMFCVTFIDVALKQTWPEKFLDAEVLKRVTKLQQDFPALLPPPPTLIRAGGDVEEEPITITSEWDPLTKTEPQQGGPTMKYTRVVSQEPYVTSSCVDEDLVFILANNNAYGNISSYCASTVRGYAMLSTMLLMGGFFFGFLWMHNAMIDPIGSNYARYSGIVGYCLVVLTGIVMYWPDPDTVYRNRNILLWDTIPTSSWIIYLHDVGIIGFCIVPMLGNLWQVVHSLLDKQPLPNHAAMEIGIVCQIVGFVVFLFPGLFVKHGTPRQSNQIAVIGEIIAVMASFLSFIQIETYSTAACAQMTDWMDKAIFAFLFGTFATLVAKTYAGAPKGAAANNPSVILMNDNTPVAQSGPVPVLNYDRLAMVLPIVQPASK